ncbi:MAG: hypothetical protein ACE5KM_03855 [Planctomycetaceae bacterium]
MPDVESPIVMEEILDAAQLSQARRQRQQFDRNSAWLQANIAAVYSQHRGKCICVAGQELFVGDGAEEAIALAAAAHPDDRGRFTRYVPREKMARVYAI